MSPGAASAAAQRPTVVSEVDSVAGYLRRLGKITLLTAQEEVTLAVDIEAGVFAAERLRRVLADEEAIPAQLRRDLLTIERAGHLARAALIEANLRLVVSIAKRYAGRGLAFLDLIQEGNIGLIRAVEKFDCAKGYKFSTYATWWIRQAVGRALAEQSRTVRIPVHISDQINQIARARREHLRDHGREPSPAELAQQLAMTPARVEELQHIAREPLSLDQTVGDDGHTALGDLVADPYAAVAFDTAAAHLLHEQVRMVLSGLTEREAGILRLRFGLHDGRVQTLDEVARVYGVSRERIRQIEYKTMTKLRHPSRARLLRDYLDAT